MTRSIKLRLITAVTLTLGMLAPLLGPAVTPASAVADVQTERIGGADRFATAANVARASHPGASTAIIANGLNFPDALAGSTLAGALNAPILLVAPRSIPTATSSALTELGVNDVVIVGGPAAVSTEVENRLRQDYGVTRVFGDDRYKTAVEIARRAAVAGVGTVDGVRTAFVSTGLNFPDALGAGPLAYEGNLPSFLTRTNELPPEVGQAIRDLNIEHVVILGGTQAVSGNVEAQLETIGVTTERLNGRNRAETATFVADFAVNRMGFEAQNVILARGDNFPDALAGGPLGGERRAVILLTATPCQLAIETRDWLEEHFGTVTRITALGGQSAVCDAVLREAERAAETNNIPPDRVQLVISGGSTDGGPEWQYQESDASPSKSLTLSAFVSSDPSEGTDPDAERAPAAREDIVFNIRPSEGDPEGNTELNLTARTGTDGKASVTYTRANPGTDIITVRLADATTITDDGVGRWGTATAPILLDPNEPATLEANQHREFVVRVPGTDPRGVTVNLTTLELVDDDPSNDTNVAALSFTGGSDHPEADPATGVRPADPTPVTDDRGDNDQTVATVVARPSPDEPGTSIGIFTVTSNSAQIFTMMAFLDSVTAPPENDDNTNPPEYRDIGGVTVFTSDLGALNVTPAFRPGADTDRVTGQQRAYTVNAVDEQGQTLSQPIDVSFVQLTDGDPFTTTTAEIDWIDNDENLTTQEVPANQTPPGATDVPEDTTRLQVVPNSKGQFTFAITNDPGNLRTEPTPIVWLDLPGGRDNRPDQGEPQSRGDTTDFNDPGFVSGTLESLGCPPGTEPRGTESNPAGSRDPCLGSDVNPNDPHVPWELDVAAASQHGGSDAASTDPAAPGPRQRPSRGDVVFRYTFRNEQANPEAPAASSVQFDITNVRCSQMAVTIHGEDRPALIIPGDTVFGTPTFGSIEMPLTQEFAEILIDCPNGYTHSDNIVEATVQVTVLDALGLVVEACDPTSAEACHLIDKVRWVANQIDTTQAGVLTPASAPATVCPNPLQNCYNGNVLAVDKAREYYVMQSGASGAPNVYVVYARGGGAQAGGAERVAGVDQYFIDGIEAQANFQDPVICETTSSPGCAQFESALTPDDRMVYEYGPATQPASRDQTHFLTNGTAPLPT